MASATAVFHDSYDLAIPSHPLAFLCSEQRTLAGMANSRAERQARLRAPHTNEGAVPAVWAQ